MKKLLISSILSLTIYSCGDGSGDIVYKNDKVNAGSLDKDCNPINKFCPFCKSLIEIDNFKVKSDGIYRVGCIKCREYALNNMIFFDELDKYSSYEGSRKMMLEHKKRISIDEINDTNQLILISTHSLFLLYLYN